MRDVVRMMVGVDIEQHYPKVVNAQPAVCLEVENLSTDHGVDGVSFTIHVGEVLGLGGMVGSGRTEIARALFGLDKHTGGTVRLMGKCVNFSSPTAAIAHGVGLIQRTVKPTACFSISKVRPTSPRHACGRCFQESFSTPRKNGVSVRNISKGCASPRRRWRSRCSFFRAATSKRSSSRAGSSRGEAADPGRAHAGH